MSLICPHCGNVVLRPSVRQIEAFRLVYVRGLTQLEAAERLGIRQKNVSRLLFRLRHSFPELFLIPHKKFLSYDSSMDCVVRRKF